MGGMRQKRVMRERRERKYSKATYVYQPNCVSAKILIEIRTMLLYFFDPKMVKSDLRGNVISEKPKVIARTKSYRFTSDEIKHFFSHLLDVRGHKTSNARQGGSRKSKVWEVGDSESPIGPSSRFRPRKNQSTCLFDPRVFQIPLIHTSNHNQRNQTCCDS